MRRRGVFALRHPVESATYCRSCARTLLDAPDGQSIEPFEPP